MFFVKITGKQKLKNLYNSYIKIEAVRAMTVNLEKIFFIYILNNKKFIMDVEPYYFKNPELSLVYKIVRDHYIKEKLSEQANITNRQIVEMVRLEDKDKTITGEILKSILTTTLDGLDENTFIRPKFDIWRLINRAQNVSVNIMDKSRELDNVTDMMELLTTVQYLKDMVATLELSDTGDDDLCSDFDDLESHVQDNSTLKVRSGIEHLDHMLGGGWDVGTLNILMAATNAGKSLWMQNLAVNTANLGYNVLYITLEMSEKKVTKRTGSMRLRIPINQYDNLSQDKDYMRNKLDNFLKQGQDGDDFFNAGGGTVKPGKLLTKFYAAGTATYQDFNRLIHNLKRKYGDIHFIVVDYLTLIAPVKGTNLEGNLYMKGKHIAEGLRAIAAEHKAPLLTAIQVSKDAWNTNDITLDKIPESKAIAETADTFFAIIRTELMKAENKYRLKLLKQRDGDFSRSHIMLDLNPVYLTLENPKFCDAIGMAA